MSSARLLHPPVATFAVLTLGLGACFHRAEPEAPPNVLLIVIDTLGAKHLESNLASVGQGEPSFTPHLDSLAAQGVRFEQAFSTAPWTQPAIASLMTSRFPAQHGVRNLMDDLPANATTLAERLSEAGYATGAVISHFLIDEERGFGQGFETFDTSAITEAGGLSAKRVTTRAIRFLEQQEGPFFLFLHYFDPHSLYNHHPEFNVTAGYDGHLRPGMGVWEVRDQRQQLSPSDIDYLVGLYHEEIAYTDHHIGRLLAKLDELGHAENTVVTLTADHGEEFMEHGWIGHTRTLYDELLHVPLLFRWPEGRSASVAIPVSILDIAPTLLEFALGGAYDAAAEGCAGRSLAGVLHGIEEPESRPVFAEVSFDSTLGDPARAAQKKATKTAVVHGSWKLVHDLEADTWLLFDRDADPGEHTDLFRTHEAVAATLRKLLSGWEHQRSLPSDFPGGEGDEGLDAQTLRALEQLGYVR